MKGVGPLTMSASRRAAASGSPTHPRGERYLRYRPGWTLNEIPSGWTVWIFWEASDQASAAKICGA